MQAEIFAVGVVEDDFVKNTGILGIRLFAEQLRLKRGHGDPFHQLKGGVVAGYITIFNSGQNVEIEPKSHWQVPRARP